MGSSFPRWRSASEHDQQLWGPSLWERKNVLEQSCRRLALPSGGTCRIAFVRCPFSRLVFQGRIISWECKTRLPIPHRWHGGYGRRELLALLETWLRSRWRESKARIQLQSEENYDVPIRHLANEASTLRNTHRQSYSRYEEVFYWWPLPNRCLEDNME